MGVPVITKASASTDAAQWGQTFRSTLGGQEKTALASVVGGAMTLDCAVANVFVVASVNADITSWTWNNLPVSDGCVFKVATTMGATLRTIALPSGTLHWLTRIPVHEVNKSTFWTWITFNGGFDWFVSAYVEGAAEDNSVGGSLYQYNNAI